MNTQKSKFQFDRAKKIFPGGVNSPVRAFRGVDADYPLFIKKGQGPFIWDADGNRLIDYVGSWGSAILGHADQDVISAVTSACKDGLSFGAPTDRESDLASLIQEAMPSLERMRFVSSGTEACMTAIRLARGFTGKNKIIKFNGNYHGHCDSLLVKAGSGLATFSIVDSLGVGAKVAEDTLVVEYNDLKAVEGLFANYASDIAGIIFEPIVGNSGFIKADSNFLNGLRKLCDTHQAVLIMDEVMTGFRVAWKGAQHLYNIKPDLTTLGKVIGGGMPLAALGGRKDIMESLSPLGSVYQAGTLSGNPVATACGLATLRKLKELMPYEKLNAKCEKLCQGMQEIAAKYDRPFVCDWAGGMFGYFFAAEPIKSFTDAKNSDAVFFKTFFKQMLERGIYLPPSCYEASFMSTTHDEGSIEHTLAMVSAVLAR